MGDPKLTSILDGRRSQPHQLIEVLQDMQENYGYIPEDRMEAISKELGVPLTQVYGVASFYKAFSLKPRGRNVITVCTGTACHIKGAGRLTEELKRELNIDIGQTTEDMLFSLEEVRCLGCCSLAPAVKVNDKIFGGIKTRQIRKIVDDYRKMKSKGKVE